MQTNPSPSAAGRCTSSLSCGAQLFIFGMRQWYAATKAEQCVRTVLQPFYHRFGADRALPTLDELMCVIAVSAQRPLQLNCLCRAEVAEDELMLLQCLRALQRGDAPAAAESLQPIIGGPLTATCLRVAHVFVGEMAAAQLPLTGVRYLERVK